MQVSFNFREKSCKYFKVKKMSLNLFLNLVMKVLVLLKFLQVWIMKSCYDQ